MTEADEITDVDVFAWHVMFIRAERQYFWDWLTDPDYRHCLAYGYCNGRWIVMDPANERTMVLVLTEQQFSHWLDEKLPRASKVIRMAVQMSGDLRLKFGLWCVPAIKHLIGFKSGALRPKALCRDLLRNGGKVCFEHGRQGESPY